MKVTEEKMMVSERIGELLIDAGHVQSKDIDKALVAQQQVGGLIGSILVRSGVVSETNLLGQLSRQLGAPVVSQDIGLPTEAEIFDALGRSGLGPSWFSQQEVIVWQPEGAERIFCLSRGWTPPYVLEQVERAFRVPVDFCLAREQTFESLLGVIRSKVSEQALDDSLDADVQQLRELAEEAPVVEFVNNVISQALEERASDIHIEPELETFDVRFRVDGVLYTKRTMPLQRYHAAASRIKLISGLDIAERRLPQDGRVGIRINGVDLDIRVSTLPSVHGESLVMRLLPKERDDVHLERLGMLPDHLEMFRSWMDSPHGIVMVTGPTGSGKSTTLYSALEETNDGARKLVTVEDPVEFKLNHVTQVQVHSEIGLSFASALRSILRQDPDVIMIGEIRDLETADIAIQAALTGHLVLSTLHTNDALSAFTRLVDMGVEPFLAASPVVGVQAQRLVRRLCMDCAKPVEMDEETLDKIRPYVEQLFPGQSANWHEAVGCVKCQDTGFLGRIGIYELVSVTDGIRERVVERAPFSELHREAEKSGFRNLHQDGLVKAWLGQTTVDEVLRVTSVYL